MSDAAPAKPLFDLKSTAWILTALRLHSADSAALGAALDARFADSPGLFDGEPLVLDLSPLRAADAVLDWPALLAHLQRHQMRAVAAQGGSTAQMGAAREAGLFEATEPEARAEARPPQPTPAAGAAPTAIEADRGPLAAGGLAEGAAADAALDDAAAAAPALIQAAAVPTLVLDKPLRSGQRVYARGADLVVLAVVSFGAEVIADGHIHVYAPLRGRAIAGARGNVNARIFSTCMEPQLVSIAGTYRTTETPLPAGVLGRAAQVRLDGDKLLVEPLNP